MHSSSSAVLVSTEQQHDEDDDKIHLSDVEQDEETTQSIEYDFAAQYDEGLQVFEDSLNALQQLQEQEQEQDNEWENKEQKHTGPFVDQESMVDLTMSDDEYVAPVCVPPTVRSASAVVSSSTSVSLSMFIPPPAVRRSITDFFYAQPQTQNHKSIKQEEKKETAMTPPSSLSPTASTVGTTWNYLLIGKSAISKEKSSRPKLKHKVAKGAMSRGRDEAKTSSKLKSRPFVERFETSFSSPALFQMNPVKSEVEEEVKEEKMSDYDAGVGGTDRFLFEDDEYKDNSTEENNTLRTLEHIRRFSLRSGFMSGVCPSHKKITGTNIIVDGFQWSLSSPQATTFFLSHHHSDHTIGLYKGWDVGIIYCSPITATLLVNEDGIAPHVIRAVPLHQRVFVDGVFVTLIDANHCPGAVIMVFELPPFADPELMDNAPAAQGKQTGRLIHHGPVYVHCGDFRYCDEMGQLFRTQSHTNTNTQHTAQTASTSSAAIVPSAFTPYSSLSYISSLSHLSRLTITGVYLDTTYCSSQYDFPPQADIVQYTLQVVQQVLEKEKRNNQKIQQQLNKRRQSLPAFAATAGAVAHSHSHTHSSGTSSSSSSNAAKDDALVYAMQQAWTDTALTLLPSPSSSFLDGYQRQLFQRTLFLVGSYSIGKEKVFLEIARQYGMKIYASAGKIRLLKQLRLFDVEQPMQLPRTEQTELMKQATALPVLPQQQQQQQQQQHQQHMSPFTKSHSWSTWDAADVLTADIRTSRLHVVPLSYCSLVGVAEYLDPLHNSEMMKIQDAYHSVVCFRPTGWVGKQTKVAERTIKVNVINPHKQQQRKQPPQQAQAQEQQLTGKKRKGAAAVSASASAVTAASPTVVYPKRSVNVFVHHIPYSEHSSYSELQRFVSLMIDCGLQRDQLIPTVDIQQSEVMIKEFNPLFQQQARARQGLQTPAVQIPIPSVKSEPR